MTAPGAPRFARHLVTGVVYLLVIAGLMTLAILVYTKQFVSTVDVSLVTPDAGTSLQTGADVEARGVVVGSVGSITTNGVGARIGLKLSPGQAARLPANVGAELLPKTLFGQRYVDLVLPSRPSADHLHNGDVIRPNGAGPAEIQDVFAHLLPVLRAVRPAELAQTLGAVAASLRNEGDNLGATIRVFARYLHRFAPTVPGLLGDIHRLRGFAQSYTTAAPDLIAALRNFTVSSRTLAEQRAQFASLLSSVTGASNHIGGFLRANSQDIITLSRSSLPSLRVLAHYSPEFPCLARTLADFIPVMNSALGAGTNEPGLHITAKVVPGRTAYRTGSTFHARGGPSCPQVPTGVDGTAYQANISRSSGIGTANSPQENEVIAELMAGSAGTTPSRFPKWGSLLLGPALRGAAVTVR